MKTIISVLAFLMLSQAYAQVSGQTPGQAVGAQTETVVVAPAPVQAQTQAQETAQKRTVIYDERTNELVEVQPQVVESAQSVQQSSGPVYILNSQKYQLPQATQLQAQYPVQPQIQEQPVQVIQDTPLTASQAEQIRKQRQDAELATEDGIVQALERARMEDEMRRRQQISNAITGQPAAVAPPPPVMPQPQPFQQVVPAPTPAPQPRIEVIKVVEKDEAEEAQPVDIRAEVRAALEEVRPKEEPKQKYYISAQAGLAEYPDAYDVEGTIATGVTVGAITPERVVAEISFHYSEYELGSMQYDTGYYGYYNWMVDSGVVDATQYNVGAALKYQILPGRLSPSLGATVAYTRRSYSDQYYGDLWSTDAFDVGFVAGLDFQVTDSFALGFDFRYLTNIANRSDDDMAVYYSSWADYLEDMDYYLGTLSGKFTF